METTPSFPARVPATAPVARGLGLRARRRELARGCEEHIDFHGLSRSVQERFAACVAGRSEPRPLLAWPEPSRASLGWLAVVVVAIAASAIVVASGFGDLGSARALHGPGTLVAYAALLAIATLGLVRLALLRMRAKALPFRRGVYVFPLDLVDAREEILRVFSLAELESVGPDDRDPRTIVLRFPGETFTFRVEDAGAVDETIVRVAHGREEARSAERSDDPRVTWSFRQDPLQRPRVSAALGSRAPLSRRLPRWTVRAWVVAPITGALLAAPTRAIRNHASDARMYARATAAGDATSYRAYVDRGGARSAEVERIHLPRAELRDAIREGTVEAIDRFAAAHPGSAIEDEIAAARKDALLDALERAKRKGTISALHAFVKQWPDHGLDTELREAMHGLFAPALAAYRHKPMQSDEVRGFVERLFRWSEAKAHAGSAATTIQIRFRRKISPTLRKADKMVANHHWFLGEASYPSRYFDAAHAVAREERLADALSRKLSEAFGPTVFTVERGPRLEDGAGPLPPVTEPTLFVTHTEEWLGRFDGSITKPRGVWVALTFGFETEFVIPGDPKPLAFAFAEAERIPHPIIRQNPQGGTPAAPLEEKIYGAMADAAFRRFEGDYLRGFLPLPRAE